MKAWQIFAIGVVVVLAALMLRVYEPLLAALGALAIVAVVVFGFLLRPLKEVFYVRTTKFSKDIDDDVFVEHDCLAVQLELVRLWLLFAPTFLAVAFLLITSTKGSTWHFSLIDRFWEISPFILFCCRALLWVVSILLFAWVTERRVFRNAEACNPGSVSIENGHISYMFVDRADEYYGGEGFLFLRPKECASIVIYNVHNPSLNKIMLGCVFHKLIVIGRGVPDLGELIVKSTETLAVSTSET